MISTTIGDQFWAQMFKNHIGQTKNNLATVTDELATGRHSDLASAQTPNLGLHAAMQSQLSDLSAFRQIQRDADVFFTTVDLSLDHMQSVTGELGQDVLKTSQSVTPDAVKQFTERAFENMRVYFDKMQVTPLGLTQFGNLGTDLALDDPENLINDLLQQVAPLSDDAAMAKNQVINLVTQKYNPPEIGQPSFIVSATSTFSISLKVVSMDARAASVCAVAFSVVS